MRSAMAWGLIDADPVSGTHVPRDEHHAEVLDEAGINAYLDAFRGHPLEAIVVVSIATGLRPCEVYALDWKDIDLNTGVVKVYRGYHQSGGEVWFGPPKTERSNRPVTLPPFAVDILRPLKGIGPLATHNGERAKPQQRSAHVQTARPANTVCGPCVADPIRATAVAVPHVVQTAVDEDGRSAYRVFLRRRHVDAHVIAPVPAHAIG